MKPIAQPDTNKLLNEVNEYIVKGEKINDFCKRRLLKAAANQPALERQYAISALIYTAAGDKNLAKEQAYLAIKYIEQPATFTHTLMSFQLNGLNLDIINTIRTHEYLLEDLEFAKTFIPFLLSLPNIFWIERIKLMLEKAHRLDSYTNDVEKLRILTQNANVANNEFGIDKSVVGNISELVAGVAQDFDDVVLNYTSLSLSPSGEWFSLTYYVELEDTLLADLNWELGSKIIEMELDELPLVARFEAITSNVMNLRKQYYASKV